MHLSMLSPRGGGPWAYVGHLTSIAFPTLGNLTKNLGFGWGRLLFLQGAMGRSHIVPCALLWIPVLSSNILPVWRWKTFQSGVMAPANNLYPIDDHRALTQLYSSTCIALDI